MKQSERIELSREVFEFKEKYGYFGIDEPTGKWIYYNKKEDGSYLVLEEMTSSEIEELIKKSLADNHDYLYDILCKDWNELRHDVPEGAIL